LPKSLISQFAFHPAGDDFLCFACFNVFDAFDAFDDLDVENDSIPATGSSRCQVMAAEENRFALIRLRNLAYSTERNTNLKTAFQSSKISQTPGSPPSPPPHLGCGDGSRDEFRHVCSRILVEKRVESLWGFSGRDLKDRLQFHGFRSNLASPAMKSVVA
jgi:hypothetical protein